MTTASVGRRAPVQERSRQTVSRILEAAAEIADELGADAVTTRSVADRAGVSYPSLYRFFPDREAILEGLLEKLTEELDARCIAAEQTWTITSVEQLLNNEIDLHIAYYTEHPVVPRMWMGGHTSPAVTAYVRARMRALANRMHALLVDAGLIPADTEPLSMLVVVEMGDRVLELAYRNSADGGFDPEILAVGRRALIAACRDLARDLAEDRGPHRPR